MPHGFENSKLTKIDFFRYRHEVLEYKNQLFVLGGGTATDNDGFDQIYAFDLDQNKWMCLTTHGDSTIPIDESIVEQFPEPRKCHSCVQKGKCKYIFDISNRFMQSSVLFSFSFESNDIKE